MLKRQVINLPGVTHVNPTPMAVKLGNMVFSSAIMGKNPATQQIPDNLAEEVEFVFNNMKSVIELSGGTTDHIGHINFFVRNKDIRDLINAEWIKMFPDETNRPVRHVVKIEMPKGVNIQAEFIAVIY